LPLVPSTGRPITQEEIDDAVVTDCQLKGWQTSSSKCVTETISVRPIRRASVKS